MNAYNYWSLRVSVVLNRVRAMHQRNIHTHTLTNTHTHPPMHTRSVANGQQWETFRFPARKICHSSIDSRASNIRKSLLSFHPGHHIWKSIPNSWCQFEIKHKNSWFSFRFFIYFSIFFSSFFYQALNSLKCYFFFKI